MSVFNDKDGVINSTTANSSPIFGAGCSETRGRVNWAIRKPGNTFTGG